MTHLEYYQMRHTPGWIEVICGGMFSGKTEELIRRVKRAQIARQQVQVFKPEIDNRYVKEAVNSHAGGQLTAERVTLVHAVYDRLPEVLDELGIPEVHGVLLDLGVSSLQLDDTGRGFDMRYAEKLFTPFQRLHGPEEGAGHGMGLAIVRRIVGRHGGNIRADSAPGQGTTFHIELPDEAPADNEASA